MAFVYKFILFCRFRILCAGATLPPVKMEVHAGSREPLTPASVRLGGLASTVTYPVYPVRLQPNSKVCPSPACAINFLFLLEY